MDGDVTHGYLLMSQGILTAPHVSICPRAVTIKRLAVVRPAPPNVCYWHLADIDVDAGMSAFGGKADIEDERDSWPSSRTKMPTLRDIRW